MKGIFVFGIGRVEYEVFEGYFLGADIQMRRKGGREGKRRRGGGDTGVCALASTWSHSALIFLLSFWKVGSCSEAIRVFSPCWCVPMWALQVVMASPFSKGREGGCLLRQHIKKRGKARKGPRVSEYVESVVCVLLVKRFPKWICIKNGFLDCIPLRFLNSPASNPHLSPKKLFQLRQQTISHFKTKETPKQKNKFF